MQQFVRTVNTTDAFKMKLEQLEKEYERGVGPLKQKVSALYREIESFNNVGVGTGVGGGIVRFIGTTVMVIAVIVFIIAIVVSSTDNKASSSGDWFSVFFPIIIGFIVGFTIRYSGVSIIKKAKERADEAYQKQLSLKTELNNLENYINQIYEKYQEEIRLQENIYQQHMLNQQQLIEQEVEAINQTSTTSSEDTKECPQCAETIKAKAKICRFCSYKFNVFDI